MAIHGDDDGLIDRGKSTKWPVWKTTPMDKPPVAGSLMELAVDIARAAGDITLDWFQSSSLSVETKQDGTPVTQADKAAELYIRERIEAEAPGSALIGEELGNTSAGPGSCGLTWYIDPIDGTKGFARGVPLYSTLLAVNDECGPAVGVIHMPPLGQTVWAGRGLGCFFNGSPARVSQTSLIVDAYVTTSSYSRWPDEVFGRVRASGAEMRGWGDGYGFALVATGRADAMVDLGGGSNWDFAPMPVIFSEAGGRCSTPEGIETIESRSFVATNGLLHEQLCSLVTGHDGFGPEEILRGGKWDSSPSDTDQ